MQASVDSLSEENQIRQGKAMMRMQIIAKKMAFFTNELLITPDQLLRDAAALSFDNRFFLEEIIEDKKHALHPGIEKVLVDLSPVLAASYQHYNRFKLADMHFHDFVVDGVTYPNSFTLFENEYEYEQNTAVRRQAYQSFYEKLGEYQHGFASNYQTHVQKEKNHL